MEENKQDSKSKRSWIQKLGSVVFEDDSSQKEEVKNSTSTPSQISDTPSKFSYSDVTQSNNANIPATLIIPNANGMFDEKFYNSFLQVLENNNIEGIDYYEFSKAKKSLDITGMADSLKYQAAFSSLQANSNLTKERLLETADFYLEKLNAEESNFSSEMQHEVESQINSRLNQAKLKQEEIAKKQEEINRLQSEMASLQVEIGTLNLESQQIQAKIDSTAKNFKVSLEVLKNQINLDKKNINTYIQ